MVRVLINRRINDLECKMIEISSDEIKKIALSILVDFDRVCNKHHLRYSLTYGTLLGAVRHKGFIPWDDDIDVMMPRSDFERFSYIADTELKNNHRLLSVNKDLRFGAPLPKIIDTNTVLHQVGHILEKMDLGVYIDIFILDRIPDNYIKKRYIYEKCKFYNLVWRFCGNYVESKYRVLNQIRKCANNTSLGVWSALKLMNINQTISDTKGKLNTILIFPAYGYKNNEISEEDFNDFVALKFEGYDFFAISKYELYLKRFYGDYMKMPPFEKRVANHNFVCFMKDDYDNKEEIVV